MARTLRAIEATELRPDPAAPTPIPGPHFRSYPPLPSRPSLWSLCEEIRRLQRWMERHQWDIPFPVLGMDAAEFTIARLYAEMLSVKTCSILPDGLIKENQNG